jgi:hypothetical protein
VVSAVGELLELLYTARDHWTTVQATIRQWTHLERSHLAYERHLRETRGVGGESVPAGSYGDLPGQHPRELSMVTRVWLDDRRRFREERPDSGMTIVSDGRRATIYTPESGLVEHESETLRPTVDHLVDPSVLIPSLEFAVTGEAELAGRRALVVEASPRPPRLPPIELVPYGCREVTLHVDRETGVLLRIEGEELRLVGGNQLPGPPLEVHLERGGTHIRVWSDNLDERSLIDVATSLAPASTELPPTRE